MHSSRFSSFANLTFKMSAKLIIFVALTLQHSVSITDSAPASVGAAALSDASASSSSSSASSSPYLDGRPHCGVIEASAGASLPVSNSILRRFYVVEEASYPSSPSGKDKYSLWPRPYLTYRVSAYSSRLPRSLVEEAIVGAFAVWSSATPFRFTRVVDPTVEADIVIKFASRFHGDAWAFDGPRGVLAHAFRPNAIYDELSGDVHFDDDEDWTVKSTFGINLMQLAAHEIGHSLGFQHVVDDSSSIMWPYAKKYDPNFALSPRDIETAKKLYPRFFEMSAASASPPPGPVYFDNKNDKVTTKAANWNWGNGATTKRYWPYDTTKAANWNWGNGATTKRYWPYDTTYSKFHRTSRSGWSTNGWNTNAWSTVTNGWNTNSYVNRWTTPSKWNKSGGNKMTTPRRWIGGPNRITTPPAVAPSRASNAGILEIDFFCKMSFESLDAGVDGFVYGYKEGAVSTMQPSGASYTSPQPIWMLFPYVPFNVDAVATALGGVTYVFHGPFVQRYRRVDRGPLYGVMTSLDYTPLPISALGLPLDVKKVEAAFPAWDRLILIADGRRWFEYDGVTSTPVNYAARCGGGGVECVWPSFTFTTVEAAMKYQGLIYLFADDRRWFVVDERGVVQDSKVCY